MFWDEGNRPESLEESGYGSLKKEVGVLKGNTESGQMRGRW